MPSIKYIPLFQIDLMHGYYANGICQALTLQPTAATQLMMRRIGLKFLAKTNGGTVYGRVEKAGANWRLISKLPNGLYLQFVLTSNGGIFYPITLLPAAYKPTQLMVFSNLANHVFGGKALLVKNSPSHQFSAADLVEKAQGSFSFSKASAANATVRLQLQSTGQQFEMESPLHQGQIKASFNLTNADGGLANLSINGVFEKTIYVLPPDAPGNTLGIIDIFYNDSLPTNYQFMTPTGLVNSKIYQVPFAAAQARWRYKIQRLFNDSITGIAIEKGNPGAIAFNTVAGAEAGSFISTSSTAIALSDQPIKGITLKNQSNKILVPHLPNPAINQIVTDTDGVLYAEMLVSV